MVNKIINITFCYPEYDDEGTKIVAQRKINIKYDYNITSKKLIVSVNGKKPLIIKHIDKMNFNDMSCMICDLLPDDINDLGAPISLIEDFIFNGFLENSNNVDIFIHSKPSDFFIYST